MTVRIDRKNSNTQTPVARTEGKPTVASVAKSATAAVTNAFTGTATSVGEKLAPAGKALSRSASPEALWGQVQDGSDFAAAFLVASAVQQGEKITDIQAQLGALSGQIGDRVEVLEKKWKHQRLENRADMLKDFADRTDIPPQDRVKLQQKAGRAQELSKEIRARAAELKAEYPPKTPEEAAARKTKMRELVALRKEQRALVYEAKAMVEQKKDQNVVLLATNEQKLDPNAPKNEPSLMSLLGKWLHLSAVLDFFMTFAADTAHKKSEESRDDAKVAADRIVVTRRRRETEGLKQSDLLALRQGLKLSA